MAEAPLLLREAVPQIIATLVAAGILAALSRLPAVRRYWRQAVEPRLRWRTRGGLASTTEDLLRRLRRVVLEVGKLRTEDHRRLGRVVLAQLAGRDQALKPFRDFLLGVVADCREEADRSARKSLRSAAEDLQNVIHVSSEATAAVGVTALSKYGGSLVQSLVLADFSVPILRMLRSLARHFPNEVNAVRVDLIAADRRFLSSQDTRRWLTELSTEPLSRFFFLGDKVSFRNAAAYLRQVRPRRPVILAGTERITSDGRCVVFPGINALVTLAAAEDIDVLMVGQTFKVTESDASLTIGADASGAAVELGVVTLSQRIAFVSDHALHVGASTTRFESLRPSTKCLRCCYRYHRNRQERKRLPLGVVFDLDGTVLDSEKMHRKLYQDVAQDLGYSLSAEEYLDELQGMTDEETIAAIAGRAGWRGSVEKLIAAKQRKFREAAASGVIAEVRGARRFVSSLYRAGFSIGLATSATREEAEAGISALGLRGVFAERVVGKDVSSGKPAPDIYLEAMDRLGLVPGECLVYEDSLQGIRAGVAAGAAVVGVGDLLRPEKEAAGAFLTIRDFSNHQLPELS